MQDIIQISTHKQNGLYDITDKVRAVVKKSGIQQGIATVYAQGSKKCIIA